MQKKCKGNKNNLLRYKNMNTNSVSYRKELQ